MKFFLITFLLVSSLFAAYPVAKFGLIDGEVYVLRHGKLLKAFNGFQIDEYDTIYSKSFSKAKVFFPNNVVYNIKGKKTINVKNFMDANQVSRLKTTQQIRKEKAKKSASKTNTLESNSKFYKQRAKVQQRELEKSIQQVYIDKRRNVYVNTETDNVSNVSDDESGDVNIGNVNIDSRSDVKNVTITGKSTNISNFSKGQGTHSKVEVGNINVK